MLKAQAGNIRLFRVFTIAVAVLTIAVSIRLSFRWTEPGLVYVSQNGPWYGDGSSWASAYPSIQRALDQALPGDTIRIADGIYRERLQARRSGTADAPITLEAAHPGAVTVTWSTDLEKAVTGRWEDQGNGIWAVGTRWPIYRIQRDGADLYRVPFGGLAELKTISQREHAWDCFRYADDRLWVWLRGHSSPAAVSLVTHGRVPEPREWGEFKSANLMADGSYLRLAGINFEFGIGAGVMLGAAKDIEVLDCSFSAATFGVSTLDWQTSERRIGLNRCLYSNYPQCEWRRGWLSWAEVYAGYASSSLIAASADQVSVERCVVAHGGDAMRVTNSGQSPHARLVIQSNQILNCTDDAFELEGAARNITVSNNLVSDCHESLGLSPVKVGPVRISKNVFLHPFSGVNGAQVKLINPKPAGQGIRNITISDNLFVGNWLCWSSGPIEDVTVENNAFVVRYTDTPPWPDGVLAKDNALRVLGDEMSGRQSLVDAVQMNLTAKPHLRSVLDHAPRKAGPDWNWKAVHPKAWYGRENMSHLLSRVAVP